MDEEEARFVRHATQTVASMRWNKHGETEDSLVTV